jgi:hypothetical protein
MHRIREIMKSANGGVSSPLGGEGKTLEADTTYIGRKPGRKVGRGVGHMRPVFALIERDGKARSFHMPNVRADTLHSVLGSHANPAASS